MGIKRIIKRIVVRALQRVARSYAFESVVSGQYFVNRIVQMNLVAAKLNGDAFAKYKGINTGKNVILFATGPSIRKFRPIPGCVKVGVNHAFQIVKDLDYYLATDNAAISQFRDELKGYKGNHCVKFFGMSELHAGWNLLIPESDVIDLGAKRFVIDSVESTFEKYQYAYDISVQPLRRGMGCVFSAMQFILWTNPKRVYLVGCDCSQCGHFFESDNSVRPERKTYLEMIPAWQRMKEFAALYYPRTEIVSVNPVGLKGMFADLFQE